MDGCDGTDETEHRVRRMVHEVVADVGVEFEVVRNVQALDFVFDLCEVGNSGFVAGSIAGDDGAGTVETLGRVAVEGRGHIKQPSFRQYQGKRATQAEADDGDVVGIGKIASDEPLTGVEKVLDVAALASFKVGHAFADAGEPAAAFEEIGYKDGVTGGGEIVGNALHFFGEAINFVDEKQAGKFGAAGGTCEIGGHGEAV